MEHITSRDGTQIGFRRSGAGRPLLLVHGTTADRTRWTSILPQLEPNFTVYAMDRRGRGGSGDSPHYDLMREAEDVAAVVEAIGGPVFVLGHSFGGRCCLEAALMTDNIDRLILYEPPIPATPPSVPADVPDRMLALIDLGEPEAVLEIFFREIVGMPENELAAFRRLPMWAGRIPLAPTIPREMTIDRTRRFNAEKYAGLELPVLLLLGGDSLPFFRQAIEMVDSALPNSSIVVLPGQRHVAMDSDPELFIREVLDFLRV